MGGQWGMEGQGDVGRQEDVEMGGRGDTRTGGLEVGECGEGGTRRHRDVGQGHGDMRVYRDRGVGM